jgi:putative autotransporter adhesin-like protein
MFRRAFKFLLFASALGLGGLLAASIFKETVVGSGKPATEDRQVGAVTDVSLSGIGNLTIRQEDAPALTVTADDNLLPLIETETSGKRLTIRTKSGFNLKPSGPIAITLTVPKLEKLGISGSGNATADRLTGENLTVKLSGAGNATLREVTCKTLSISLSGAGNAVITGSAESATATISGAGEIDASGFKVANADVRVSGAGNAAVWATDELKAKVSGAGDVTYKGSPKVDRKVSGAGSVKPR